VNPSNPPPPAGTEAGLERLVSRYGLPAGAVEQLGGFLGLLAHDPLAPTAIRDPVSALDDHLADSLVALDLDVFRAAARVLDLGSGAGLPGLPLAIALPGVSFVLLESAARKCAFLERAAATCRVSNVEVVHARAELAPAGGGVHDIVTARAVAPLEVTAEYAAPLLDVGGTLVAWRGRRSAEAEAVAAQAGAELGMEGPRVEPVHPYPGAQHRYLYLMSKVMPTPSRFPRRPGMALKRPLGKPGRDGNTSDRLQR
jgi:16S rRNA (guanine527-N7)-methyltransferase